MNNTGCAAEKCDGVPVGVLYVDSLDGYYHVCAKHIRDNSTIVKGRAFDWGSSRKDTSDG